MLKKKCKCHLVAILLFHSMTVLYETKECTSYCSSREFVLRTFLHFKIFANRSMIYLEHDFFALLSHMCFLVFCHTEQAAPRKVLSAYKSDGAYSNCANTWAHCISMY